MTRSDDSAGEKQLEEAEPEGQSPSDTNGEARSEPPDPIAALEEELAATRDRLLRTAADLDNQRKRSKREVDGARARGRDEAILELLPIFDSIQLAERAATSATDIGAILAGIRLVLTQLDGALARMGVVPIEAVGKSFDPTRHDAVQQVERDDVPPGTIVEELQRGYVAGDKLVRAALVVVARARATDAHPAGSSQAGQTDVG